MKKKGTIIGAMALTFILGCGLIFGNAAIAAKTMTAEAAPDSQANITDDASTMTAKAMVETNADGEDVTSFNIEVDGEVLNIPAEPVSDNVKTGMVSIGNGKTIIVEYYYDESVGTVKANVTCEGSDGLDVEISGSYESIEAQRFAELVAGTKQYDAWAEQVGAPVTGKLKVVYTEGEPGADELTEERAIAAATELLTEKYALKQGTLDRFTVTAKFYVEHPDASSPVWWVSLYPTNRDEFPEIGCYWALIDSKTGEAVQLCSAVDGKG